MRKEVRRMFGHSKFQSVLEAKTGTQNLFNELTILLQESETEEMREVIQFVAKKSRELLCEVYAVYLGNIQEDIEIQHELHLLDGFEKIAADIMNW